MTLNHRFLRLVCLMGMIVMSVGYSKEEKGDGDGTGKVPPLPVGFALIPARGVSDGGRAGWGYLHAIAYGDGEWVLHGEDGGDEGGVG